MLTLEGDYQFKATKKIQQDGTSRYQVNDQVEKAKYAKHPFKRPSRSRSGFDRETLILQSLSRKGRNAV